LQKEINGCNYLECCSCKKASSCIPSCACSKDTLVGKTCSNGCGGFCDGIKTETPVESNNTNTESSSSTETPVESNNTNTESSSSDSVTKLAIRFAYAGIKPNNDSCATNIWPITSKISMSSNIIGDFGAGSDSLYLTEGIPKKTSSLNSKGEIVYEYGLDFSGEGDISDIYFSFFLKGPKHIFIKYGQNKQNKWYDSLVGKIKLVPGENAFDFSEYPIFAGDVTGEINEVPDGKLDGRDWSYIKEKANKLLVAAEAGTDVSGDINGDCQVNSGDVRLIKQMLSEVNGQTY
jgi:hypothetical protein